MAYVNGRKCKDCSLLSEFAERCLGCAQYRRGYFRGKWEAMQEIRVLMTHVETHDIEDDNVPPTQR
jgi:hypothetical protein